VLAARIRNFATASDGAYGNRRIHADLAEENVGCFPKSMTHIMREEGLVACQPRPFRVTTQVVGDGAVATLDLVKRDLTADRPG